MKKWLALTLCALMLLTVAACGQETAEPDAPAVGSSQNEEEPAGTGGDSNMCTEHNMMYHAIPTDLDGSAEYIEYRGGSLSEEDSIITFVQWAKITKEEFIESMNWEDKLDEIAVSHGNGCPYTYGQYLDAIYGDDPELTAWVFNTPETEWQKYEGDWWALEEDGVAWPPEGYGFGETPPTEEPVEEPVAEEPAE